jgi:hypothetical protein
MWNGLFRKSRRIGIPLVLYITVLLFAGSAAGTAPQAASDFAGPDIAVQALVQAAAGDDATMLRSLFGPGGMDIIKSGDNREDKTVREEFVRLARESIQLHIDANNPDEATFSIGPQSWPFPVPLVRVNGKWSFNVEQGRIEILAHRIGENESDVIEICRGFVEAQLEYASQDRGAGIPVYARKAASSPGKRDGLYWDGSPDRLVSKEFTQAVGRSAKPYHGYYFRILESQGPDAPGGQLDYVFDGKMIGGFALVAWPAEYGSSGIQTFIVSHEGVVYQKDLGATTAVQASRMLRFNPDMSWKRVTD